MAITSSLFILFVLFTGIIYYTFPIKKRWLVILCAGIAFYAYSSIKTLCYFAITIIITYYFALLMQKIQDKYDNILLETENKEEKK